MIRYRYSSQLSPPAPFVNLTLHNIADGTELRGIPAQLDYAADQTVLPSRLVEALRLPQVGTQEVTGLGSAWQVLPTYAVRIALHDLPAMTLEVIGAEEPWVLLGRDALNALRILLDGPGQPLEIA